MADIAQNSCSLQILIFKGIFDSNTFLVTDDTQDSIVIDAGIINSTLLYDFIKKNNLRVGAIFLTHEHFDHVLSVEEINTVTKAPVFCSIPCANNLSSPSNNLSTFYYDNPKVIDIDCKYFKDEIPSFINAIRYTPILTPGHSPGGTCIMLNNIMFTGDTILNGTRTPLSFPHSNRLQYTQSIAKLKSYLKPGMTIYPGHGNPFTFNSFEELSL
jgi:glyoxylase-like metal-dependent hydrolase (beta-lactamase superfamily II)